MSLLEISIVLFVAIIFIITALVFAFIIREIGILRRERDELIKTLRKEKHRLVNKLQVAYFRSEINERDVREIKKTLNLPEKLKSVKIDINDNGDSVEGRSNFIDKRNNFNLSI